MITALRDVGLRGATAWEVWPQLAWLAGWVAATALVAVRSSGSASSPSP